MVVTPGPRNPGAKGPSVSASRMLYKLSHIKEKSKQTIADCSLAAGI